MKDYRKDMATTDESSVVCAFCGKEVPGTQVVTIALLLNEDEIQTVFAHAEHLLMHLHPSVPIHPDLMEAANKDSTIE